MSSSTQVVRVWPTPSHPKINKIMGYNHPYHLQCMVATSTQKSDFGVTCRSDVIEGVSVQLQNLWKLQNWEKSSMCHSTCHIADFPKFGRFPELWSGTVTPIIMMWAIPLQCNLLPPTSLRRLADFMGTLSKFFPKKGRKAGQIALYELYFPVRLQL